jgi:hypothetical protein
MAKGNKTRRATTLLFAGAVSVVLVGGTAYAVTQLTQNNRQAGSSSAEISSCDTEYNITLGAPTYSKDLGDYAVATASTDRLDSTCRGQLVTMTVTNKEGDVVSDGSSVVPANGVATIIFSSPLPVSKSYVVKTVIYGTAKVS